MATLANSKMVSLKEKLAEKEILTKELEKVEDKIDTLVGDKKVKIPKKK